MSSTTSKAKLTVKESCSPMSGMKLYKEAEPIQFGAVERTQGNPMMHPEEPEDHLYMFVCYHHFLKLVSCQTLGNVSFFEVQLSLSSKAYGRGLRLCEEYRGRDGYLHCHEQVDRIHMSAISMKIEQLSQLAIPRDVIPRYGPGTIQRDVTLRCVTQRHDPEIHNPETQSKEM